jgi:S1-C subfamily serine protease
MVFSGWVLGNLATAQDTAQIERGKAATALVDLEEARGSAFCVNPTGIFVTNAHVVDSVASDANVTRVIDPGLKSQRKVMASVVRVDEKLDLAILKTKVAGQYPYLGFAANDSAFETMFVTAFGFPFGKGLTLEKDNYPTASVNVLVQRSIIRGLNIPYPR